MSTLPGSVLDRILRARRRWARPIRWAATFAVVAIGFVVFLPATDDSDSTNNIHFAAALPIWLLAATWPLWRAPQHHLPEVLRCRSRHWRVCWRLSLLLLLGACAALIACTYWGWRADENVADLDAWRRETGHADASGRVGLWLLIACPVPGLAEAALWLLWPRSLRRQIRPARDRVAIAEALADPYRFLADTPADAARRDFDPTRGVYGLPRPIVAHPAPEEYGKPLALRRGKKPLRGRAYRLDPDPLDALLVWDGGTLFLDDGAGRMVRVPLRDTPQDKAPLPHGRRSPVRTLAQRPASMAHVTEKVRDAYVRNSDLLLLLDGDGRRLLALPAQALEDRDLAAISAAARLPFAAYDLGRARDADLLTNRLFPSRRRAP